MGIQYDIDKGSGWIEARTLSIIFGIRENETFEINYEDLDLLQEMVERAQKVRRDKKTNG